MDFVQILGIIFAVICVLGNYISLRRDPNLENITATVLSSIFQWAILGRVFLWW